MGRMHLKAGPPGMEKRSHHAQHDDAPMGPPRVVVRPPTAREKARTHLQKHVARNHDAVERLRVSGERRTPANAAAIVAHTTVADTLEEVLALPDRMLLDATVIAREKLAHTCVEHYTHWLTDTTLPPDRSDAEMTLYATYEAEVQRLDLSLGDTPVTEENRAGMRMEPAVVKHRRRAPRKTGRYRYFTSTTLIDTHLRYRLDTTNPNEVTPDWLLAKGYQEVSYNEFVAFGYAHPELRLSHYG